MAGLIVSCGLVGSLTLTACSGAAPIATGSLSPTTLSVAEQCSWEARRAVAELWLSAVGGDGQRQPLKVPGGADSDAFQAAIAVISSPEVGAAFRSRGIRDGLDAGQAIIRTKCHLTSSDDGNAGLPISGAIGPRTTEQCISITMTQLERWGREIPTAAEELMIDLGQDSLEFKALLTVSRSDARVVVVRQGVEAMLEQARPVVASVCEGSQQSMTPTPASPIQSVSPEPTMTRPTWVAPSSGTAYDAGYAFGVSRWSDLVPATGEDAHAIITENCAGQGPVGAPPEWVRGCVAAVER